MSQDIGKPYPRVDGRAKVTGQARYSHEWPTAGVLHGVLVTSSVAKGRIIAVDSGEAERQPGVVAESGGGGNVNANSTNRGPWETFTLRVP